MSCCMQNVEKAMQCRLLRLIHFKHQIEMQRSTQGKKGILDVKQWTVSMVFEKYHICYPMFNYVN